MLVLTTIVNLEILQALFNSITCTAVTHSEMGSSVKVSLALMENLLHGSVCGAQ